MPLFSIQTHPKNEDEQSGETSRAERPATKRERKPARQRGQGGISAVMLGLMVGVALLAGVTIAVLGSQLMGRGQQPSSGSGGSPGGAMVGSSGAAATMPAPLNPGPINGDYPRDHVVAVVNGQSYTMAELETAVRIARTLGSLSGDVVPAYTDQEMLGFQVKILKRQVDLILLEQALAASEIQPPAGPVDDLILGFLQQVGATEQQLAQAMAANSVSRAQLDGWFDRSRATNTFVVQTLLTEAEADPSQREALVADWLDQRWNASQISINFYDPNQVLPQVPAGSAPDSGAPAPAATDSDGSADPGDASGAGSDDAGDPDAATGTPAEDDRSNADDGDADDAAGADATSGEGEGESEVAP